MCFAQLREGIERREMVARGGLALRVAPRLIQSRFGDGVRGGARLHGQLRRLQQQRHAHARIGQLHDSGQQRAQLARPVRGGGEPHDVQLRGQRVGAGRSGVAGHLRVQVPSALGLLAQQREVAEFQGCGRAQRAFGGAAGRGVQYLLRFVEPPRLQQRGAQRETRA